MIFKLQRHINCNIAVSYVCTRYTMPCIYQEMWQRMPRMLLGKLGSSVLWFVATNSVGTTITALLQGYRSYIISLCRREKLRVCSADYG